MEEKVFVISDIEMGRGDIMDDFTDDKILADFFERLSSEHNNKKITVILNGDIFDFLKMAYKNEYPRHITEEISLWKMEEVIKNHVVVFKAWKKFVADKNHTLSFIIGNHDADIAWPTLQKRIQQELAGYTNIQFGFQYNQNGIHAEHGHLLDPFFSFNHRKPFTSYKGKKILVTPLGTQIVFNHLVHLKRKFPKDEAYYPKPLAFANNPELSKEKKRLTKKILWKDLLLGPLLHWNDPTRRVPYLKLLNHFLHYGLDVINDEKFQKRTMKKVLRKYPNGQFIVLGHSHVLGEHRHKDKKVLVTDTWRDEFDLTNNLAKKRKSYAEITMQGGKPESAELKLLEETA